MLLVASLDELSRPSSPSGLLHGYNYMHVALFKSSLKSNDLSAFAFIKLWCCITLCMLTSVSTWMGDRQGRPSAINLCPFVGVDLNLWLTVL